MKHLRFAAILMALLLVFACIPVMAEGDTIKIGICCSQTGSTALNGQYAEQGAQLAVDEINARGGVLGKQLELVVEDDGGVADTAINAMNKLQSQDLVAVVGPTLSGLAMAMEKYVQEGGIPVLIGATSPKLVNQISNDYFFRVRCPDNIMATVAVKYLVENKGCKKIGIFHASTDCGTGAEEYIIKYCEANGIPYVSEGHNEGDTDLTAQILKMQQGGVDGIVLWAHDNECALAARQFYEQGLSVPVVSSTTISTPQVYGLCENEWIEGWNFVSDFISTNPNEVVATFTKNYTERYDGTLPELYAATHYNGVMLLADCIERAGTTDSDALCEALMTTEYEGLFGKFTANSHRELVNSAIVGVMKDGAPEYGDTVTVDWDY